MLGLQLGNYIPNPSALRSTSSSSWGGPDSPFTRPDTLASLMKQYIIKPLLDNATDIPFDRLPSTQPLGPAGSAVNSPGRGVVSAGRGGGSAGGGSGSWWEVVSQGVFGGVVGPSGQQVWLAVGVTAAVVAGVGVYLARSRGGGRGGGVLGGQQRRW